MYTLSQMTWMTLWGLSLLFVGGLVLWVYGSQKPLPNGKSLIHEQYVKWFLLYGKIAIFAGTGLLLTAAIALI